MCAPDSVWVNHLFASMWHAPRLPRNGQSLSRQGGKYQQVTRGFCNEHIASPACVAQRVKLGAFRGTGETSRNCSDKTGSSDNAFAEMSCSHLAAVLQGPTVLSPGESS